MFGLSKGLVLVEVSLSRCSVLVDVRSYQRFNLNRGSVLGRFDLSRSLILVEVRLFVTISSQINGSLLLFNLIFLCAFFFKSSTKFIVLTNTHRAINCSE